MDTSRESAWEGGGLGEGEGTEALKRAANSLNYYFADIHEHKDR